MSMEITQKEAALAWAQDVSVQAAPKGTSMWAIVSPVGVNLNNVWRPNVFNCDGWIFRVTSPTNGSRESEVAR